MITAQQANEISGYQYNREDSLLTEIENRILMAARKGQLSILLTFDALPYLSFSYIIKTLTENGYEVEQRKSLRHINEIEQMPIRILIISW